MNIERRAKLLVPRSSSSCFSSLRFLELDLTHLIFILGNILRIRKSFRLQDWDVLMIEGKIG